MTRLVPIAATLLIAGLVPLHAQEGDTEEPTAPDPTTQEPTEPATQAPTTPDTATEPPSETDPTSEAAQEAPVEDEAQAPAETSEDTPASDQRAARPLMDVGADWPYWGGDARATRYSPLDQITPENVGQLQEVFTYHTGDLPEGTAMGKYSPEVTPLKLGDDLLMCSAMNILISVDAASGEENWRFDPGVPNEAIPYGASCRGVSVYTNPEAAEGDVCATRVIQGTLDAKLVAVDAETGAPCADFGENGTVDMWQDIGERVPGWYAVTAPPAIVRGVVVSGAQVKDGQAEDAPSGVVRGFDVLTGELVWAWDLAAPEQNRNGPPEGEVYTRGTPNMWTTAVADEELGYVYLPMGNSSVDYYGSNRSEAENEYATSLVALDATTGEEVWHFQTVRNDVWDYDLGSQATLLDYQGTPAVLLPSKQGDLYILDRETGEPLTPVGELSDLPKGEIEPDYISDTQPISEWHTLRKPALEEKDMWGFTPIDQLWCRIQYHRANYDGFYTPPSSEKPWIQYPGYNGGSDWGSVAVDTERGIIVANYNDVPNYNRLVPRDEVTSRPIHEMETGESGGENAEGAADPQAGAPYGIAVNAGWRNDVTGVPCTRPPYGGIRAIDLETGETLWDRPLGTARRNGPFGIPSMLPFDIGTPNNGGSVVTASGLVFIAAATDNLFRAIDIETGETLWSTVLPGGGQANPITYEVDGRQFVMVTAMGHHFMETPVNDAVIGWALPEN
ncbi:pyrroloquinoline quinone-dependent dehydrogenase [Maritimibacter sp. DP1N21-5]|uniref:pyrroloquinoline quinone-dependent dehydrogenase n=1 Tax=Maritimibacter sp. DP1N21-5 TaxID=2836867 RepID=UPI001C475609|nr:PQQ-binding-like beta-propeller repeat protein [Maritimibacter sp. DP1N21-5]MBV7410729.1 PQQ-binding-like beta-propeller repeat protein [Maritimibacter sp. DP1N21-5]